MGVLAQRSRWRMKKAVSKPSMPGICTSSRITAKSSFSKHFSASSPDRAEITVWPNSASTSCSTSRLRSSSSTMRMWTGGGAFVGPSGAGIIGPSDTGGCRHRTPCSPARGNSRRGFLASIHSTKPNPEAAQRQGRRPGRQQPRPMAGVTPSYLRGRACVHAAARRNRDRRPARTGFHLLFCAHAGRTKPPDACWPTPDLEPRPPMGDRGHDAGMSPTRTGFCCPVADAG